MIKKHRWERVYVCVCVCVCFFFNTSVPFCTNSQHWQNGSKILYVNLHHQESIINYFNTAIYVYFYMILVEQKVTWKHASIVKVPYYDEMIATLENE